MSKRQNITADQVREARKLVHKANYGGEGYDALNVKMSPASSVADALNKVLNKGWSVDGSRIEFNDGEGHTLALRVTTNNVDSDTEYRNQEAERLADHLRTYGFTPTGR